MQASREREPILRRAPSHPIYVNNDGLSPKKTAFIIVTVIGCIAILWPKVFYPMMFGGRPPVDVHKATNMRDQKGPSLGCCFNATPYFIGPQEYRKQLNLFTGEISLRQERPSHLHPDSVYQAMRERGRAIPANPTIPIIDRQSSANKPRFVEGRPGPIPGMRPPMGAGSVHQPQAKANSMGFIMPLYTIGIVIFFGYTIMKLVFKKQGCNGPYPSSSKDPLFRKEVFGQENGRHVDDLRDTKLGWREHQTRYSQPQTLDPNLTKQTTVSNSVNDDSHITGNHISETLSAAAVADNLTSLGPGLQQKPDESSFGNEYMAKARLLENERDQLMEIDLLRKKLEQTERAMSKLIAEMNSEQVQTKLIVKQFLQRQMHKQQIQSNNNKTQSFHIISINSDENSISNIADTSGEHKENDAVTEDIENLDRKPRGGSSDRAVAILGMELTASCEGGKKWKGRPPTPVFPYHSEHSEKNNEDHPEPRSIYLEGALVNKSQILVSDSETNVSESDDPGEEPAVVVSSKMTLSLINTNVNQDQLDLDSPLADDIEIISPYDQ